LKRKVAPELAVTWATVDPRAALTWAQQQSEPALRADATESVFDSWAHTEPEALEIWLADQSAGPLANDGYSELADYQFDDDPAKALATAAQISDETRRDDRVASLFGHWLGKNKGAAVNWMNQASLSGPMRAQLERLAARVSR
jgi:hypothetical protein